IVGMVLEVALYLASRGVDRDCRGRIQIVAGSLITHPGPAIAGAPEGKIGLRIIGAGDPYRTAAGLPLVTLRPGFGTRLTGRRHRVGLPKRFAGLGIEGRYRSTNPEFPARRADHYLAVGDERGERHVVALCVVLDRLFPDV